MAKHWSTEDGETFKNAKAAHAHAERLVAKGHVGKTTSVYIQSGGPPFHTKRVATYTRTATGVKRSR